MIFNVFSRSFKAISAKTYMFSRPFLSLTEFVKTFWSYPTPKKGHQL